MGQESELGILPNSRIIAFTDFGQKRRFCTFCL